MTKIDAAFWHDKWETGRIGFHQDDYHPALTKYWPCLELTPTETVFVPLCGKSKDMLYLRAQGHDVFGIELSEAAVKAFAHENELNLLPATKDNAVRHEGEGYDLCAGDFFALTSQDFKGVGAVYDRAALIALPPDLRDKYAAHLKAHLPKGTEILLITLTYDQSKISGPPFSVPEDTVQTLFGDWCRIQELEKVEPENFRGIRAYETIYRLTVIS